MLDSSRISKHTVLSSGLHDADIRPPELLNEFRRLSSRDATAFFPTTNAREEITCPACGEEARRAAFTKETFSYVQCTACNSLYVSPRPSEAALQRYFAESEASQFRVAQLSEKTSAQRRHHQLRNNATWIGQVTESHMLSPRPAYGDIRTFAPALFEEVTALNCFEHLYAIDPVIAVDDSGVMITNLENTPALDAISAFEKVEHEYSPMAFLERLHALLKPAGLLFLTTRTSSGFDLQILGEKATYIFVPEHLNLLSIRGIEVLLQRCGFELVELSTPGQLDVELVLQACTADPSIALPPFIDELLTRRDRFAHADFQAFLQKHRLSSHVRIAARKV